MAYLIYGKRTKSFYDTRRREYIEADNSFRALTYEGKRVAKLADAGTYATKEDAEEWLKGKELLPGAVFEIRAAK